MGQASPVKRGPRELAYVLEPFFGQGGPRFHINLRFRGEPAGTTTLVLPNRWAGQQHLYRAIRNLRVSSPGAQLLGTSEPHTKVIRHAPNQELRVSYELVQEGEGGPRGGHGTVYYRPIVRGEYFHWVGKVAWVHPAWDEEEAVRLSVRWEGLPRGWAVGNSFGVDRRRQRFVATVEEFKSAVFVGGDFRFASVPVGGKPVYVALRGSWRFPDAAFADVIQRIVGAEREFWSDRDTPFYLVTLLTLEAPPGVTHTGGSGLTNSFAAVATTNAGLDLFARLVAHEHFHNWNSQQLGRLKEPEQLLYWFSEGFTDYYANLLLLRGGLIGLDDYVRHYNEVISEYYLSPVRTESNRRVLEDFWDEPDVQKLPYQRGFLLAANWNALIRSATGGRRSLDDMMHDMLRAAREKRPLITAELLGGHLSRYAGRDLLPDIRRYVENGETIIPDRNALGPHVELEMTEVRLFELGFDLETLRDKKVIAGVVAESAAHRAGLRDGQVVLRRLPIEVGNASKAVELTVKDGEAERTIRFYPAGRHTISMPQYRLRAGIGSRERAENLRWLGVASARGE
jgi:predicted metalloprotease with PDZ domain